MGLALSVLAVAGCGGGATEARSTNDATRFGSDAQNEHSIADSVDGMKIEGIKGSLPARDVNEALEPRFPKFQKCFMRRYKAVEVLAGTMELSFVVSIDGRVKEVFPHASDVGDRATERCVLDVARSTSFPRPQGGEAEFS
ncbi:MAG: AgmX/PglI C-terminal domain-containing protein, partial [Polyangiales bacterium]